MPPAAADSPSTDKPFTTPEDVRRSLTAVFVLVAGWATGSYTVPLLLGAVFSLLSAFAAFDWLFEREHIYFEGRILDPRGGPRWKNFLGMGMAAIGQFKERRKFSKGSVLEHESFHEQEPHPFWNESYYYNGQDPGTDDRIITRISRHAEHGSKSYLILLIDSREHGYLCIEEDVPVESKTSPSVRGLRYEMIEPMKKWRIKFDGLARKGHRIEGAYEPITEKNGVRVQIDLEYEAGTPHVWYMRDEHVSTLGKNLSQEPWNLNFLRYCLNRSNNHGHIEDYGRLRGTITVGSSSPTSYDFGTFRDHSWDVRLWAAIDHLFILLMALREPLIIDGVEYTYLNLTLCSLRGNPIGLQKYSTGYLAGPAGHLQLAAATSLDDMRFVGGKSEDERRAPPPPAQQPATVVFMQMDPRAAQTSKLATATSSRSSDALGGALMLKVEVRSLLQPDTMGGAEAAAAAVRRLQYWPDDYSFEVFEDATHCTVATHGGNSDAVGYTAVEGYGTMQTGFRRPGKFDPSQGGCG